MGDVTFDEVWRRIEAHADETFRQKRRGELTYDVTRGAVRPNRTNRVLPRSQFVAAFEMVPLTSTVPLQRLQGPSYLYAILMDARIRREDW